LNEWSTEEMAKAKTAARRPRDGAQKQLAGMEEKISKKLQGLLEQDRDTCVEKSEADVNAKAARTALIDQMEAEGVNRIRCPFRDKIIVLDVTRKIKIEAVKQVDEGA
jgi:uncharacterized protein YbcI